MLQCYGLRRLNPFSGVVQVAELERARAFSFDGHNWQVQVLTRRPNDTWRSFGDTEPEFQYFNFGLWSQADGLSRVPANPILDIGSMLKAAEQLTGALAGHMAAMPFPLQDRFECWSVDNHGAPVALLASTHLEKLTKNLSLTHWQATTLTEHGFVSPALLRQGVAAAGELGPRQHAARLEHLVRRRGQRTVWFERCADAGGRTLEAGRFRAADAFPVYGLSTVWKDAVAGQLAQDYIDWSAPRLLTLQHLLPAQRRALEACAVRRASELADQFPLIPEVIDGAAVQAARVEAGLRRAVN